MLQFGHNLTSQNKFQLCLGESSSSRQVLSRIFLHNVKLSTGNVTSFYRFNSSYAIFVANFPLEKRRPPYSYCEENNLYE